MAKGYLFPPLTIVMYPRHIHDAQNIKMVAIFNSDTKDPLERDGVMVLDVFHGD
jgi:hypothetical protein